MSGQSLSALHAFGHDAAQKLPADDAQHSGAAVEVQSVSWLQAFGQAEGCPHSPVRLDERPSF